MKKSSKKYLTPNEVAEMLMVSPITVRQWAQKGELKALVTPGGHRRFLHRDVESFALTRKLAFAPADRHAKVLIVDDDVAVAGYLAEYFRNFHPEIEVAMAHDGFHAGKNISTFRPNIVLLDLMMPGINGFEVCRSIRTDPVTRAIRVVTMTGYFSEQNIQLALESGADECISKPIDLGLLTNVMGLIPVK